MVVVEYLDCNSVTNVKQEQCLFGTLRLLNFNIYAAEEQYKIGFKPEMFRVPCTKGLEVILHFLLSKLNPERAKKEFSASWPAHDAKRSHLFRKNVFNWITDLSREDTEGPKVPRINSSTVTKASGGVVINLLNSLASLVLLNSIKQSTLKERGEVMPPYNQKKPHLNLSAAECMRLEIDDLKQKVADKATETQKLRHKWRASGRSISDIIQSLTRKRKALQDKKEILETREKDYFAANSNDGRFIKTLSVEDKETLKTLIQHKSSQLRCTIKNINEVFKRRMAERAVLNSLINNCYGENVIDQEAIPLQVPSVLVQEYQKKLSEGGIGNTYSGGKLNLVTLSKLSLISLRMLLAALEKDSLKPRLPRPFVQKEQKELASNKDHLQQLGTWLQDLLDESHVFNTHLQIATRGVYGPSNDEIHLQSPIPVFSLKSSANSGPHVAYHVTPLTATRDTALTPLSLRKYKKGSGKAPPTNIDEEEDKENQLVSGDEADDVVTSLSFTTTNCNKRFSCDTGPRKEGVLPSSNFNDLSLLDASGHNMSLFDY